MGNAPATRCGLFGILARFRRHFRLAGDITDKGMVPFRMKSMRLFA
jgi:hypothetical protein